jgi:tetratricopeptide (TPR) repeat protein
MDQDRERVQALLNRACALEEQPLGAHLLRGYFRLDHGDSGGGLEDMAAVCASLDSPYASQWLERVRKTVAGHSLDAEDPRGPTEALDHYLCAFELLRHAQGAGDLKVARDLLTHAGLKSFRPAQELLLPVLVALIPSAGDREARLSAARGVYERALRLEEAQGRRSATTAHAIGGALLGQERYREAIEPIQAGLELAPRYHGLRSNLGIAYRRLGDLAAAARELRVTLSIRPEDRNAQLTLVRVLLQQDLFAEAELWIGKMAFADESKGQRQHLDLLGEVQYCRALAALDAGDPDGASAAARSALTHFGEGSQRVEALICQAIVAGDFRQAFAQIALVLQGEPTNWAHLRILLRAMPADLSDSQSAALRGYLGALIEHLAPARPVSETPARDSQ